MCLCELSPAPDSECDLCNGEGVPGLEMLGPLLCLSCRAVPLVSSPCSPLLGCSSTGRGGYIPGPKA